MNHRNSIARFAPPVVALVAFAMTGCADNSGGAPPAGEAKTFEIAIESPDLACGTYEDAASIIVTDADVDAFLAACEAIIEDDATIVDDLRAEVADLTEDQALVVISVVLGGCLGDWQVEAVHMDGDTLRPWIYKADSAYGRNDIGCTADIGEAHTILRVDDAASATSIEMTVGVYNPDLPGAPESTQGDEATE
jgi:hypothetical protein